METLAFDGTFAGWQHTARSALARELSPETIFWQASGELQQELFNGGSASRPTTASQETSPPVKLNIRVPRQYLTLARTVACHRDPERWALLYRTLWRLTHGEPHLLAVSVDPDVIALGEKAKAIRRDIHKMRAFVRFRETAIDGQPWFIAWFEPQHHILDANAKFFVDRFAHLNWSILTPDRCMHWDQRTLGFSEGLSRDQAPSGDVTEDLWRTYYGNIFNPSRVKINAMTKEMPRYYWKNLPEAVDIPDLLAAAADRTANMVAKSRQPRADAADKPES